MLKRILRGQINKAERDLGVSLDYMRYVTDHSTAATIRMARFMRLAEFKSPLPAPVVSVAVMASSMADDCGSCVQIAVNMARQRGVPPDVLRAVVQHEPESLSDELRDVYEFAETITSGADAPDELRQRLRLRYGERGLIDLAMAIAMHRVYPTFKRALGYATSCSRVNVAV